MRAKIQKWGNGLALRIPRSVAAEAGIGQDSEVELSLCEGKLVISPAPRPGYTLDDLLQGITPENLHGETETGPAVGAEEW
jgi:antitoxin MazE